MTTSSTTAHYRHFQCAIQMYIGLDLMYTGLSSSSSNLPNCADVPLTSCSLTHSNLNEIHSSQATILYRNSNTSWWINWEAWPYQHHWSDCFRGSSISSSFIHFHCTTHIQTHYNNTTQCKKQLIDNFVKFKQRVHWLWPGLALLRWSWSTQLLYVEPG